MSVRVITLVVVMLLIMISIKSFSLFRKQQANTKKAEELTRQIASEQARSQEIDAYQDYVSTDAYVEQIARDRLGLAYPDEILFRPLE